MTGPTRRGPRPADPVRDQLVEVRRGLLRLHKTLIEAERATYERQHAPVSNAGLLQLLIQDPFFAWLRPFSELIVQLDEAVAPREPMEHAHARALLATTRTLFLHAGSPLDLARYAQAREREPAVESAHQELVRRLAAADAGLHAAG